MMKHTKILFGVLVVLTTLLSFWVLPSLVKKMTDGAKNYPFVYYSSMLKELCVIDFVNSGDKFVDIKGNTYPRSAYDSLLPMLNFRQLMMNGTLPDSLEGQALEPKNIRMKQVVFRFYPSKVNTPQIPMGVLLEAMPKRLNLTLPGDYFCLDDKITFIDAATNKVNREKSERFTQEMIRKGFTFPAKHFWGNPSTRKPYEEGYFCLDDKGELFHVKMVNGRPFVKNTGMSSQLQVSWFAMQEVPDKRFYGFLFGSKGEVGIIESTEEGGYKFLPMDILPFDIQKDDLTVMGNMLYWTVRVTNEHGMNTYALKTNTLQSVSRYHMDKKISLWDTLSEWLFVTSLTPQTENNTYVSLYFSPLSLKALVLNIILALLLFIGKKKSLPLRSREILSIYLLFTGLAGLLSLYFLPSYEEN